MPDLNWEAYAFTPDADELPELTEFHGHRRAVRLLNTTAQQAHRLSTVESDLYDTESLADWHRRNVLRYG